MNVLVVFPGLAGFLRVFSRLELRYRAFNLFCRFQVDYSGVGKSWFFSTNFHFSIWYRISQH